MLSAVRTAGRQYAGTFSALHAPQRALAPVTVRSYATAKKKSKDPRKDPNAVELAEAVRILKAFEVGEPTHTIEAHIHCKIEKGTQIIRGSVILPRAIKEESTVLVFATGKQAEDAKKAGAHYVGGEELVEKVREGEIKDFDKCIATPAMIPHVAKIARILGPKGLMPTVKKGTVTDDVATAIRTSQNLFDFRADKNGVLHTGVGKVTFTAEEVEANLKAIMKEMRAFGKANNLKSMIHSVVLSSTRGPGLPILRGALL